MCWFTLSPAKSKKRPEFQSSDSSCVEQLVRVHSSPIRPRFTEVRVKVPSSISIDMAEHHRHHPHLHLDHHHRHHLHPLHLHPVHDHHHHYHDRSFSLYGHGTRRCSPPPGPPPPTRDSSTCRSQPHPRSPSPRRSREPTYRTQIFEPAEVRETTRIALRTAHMDRQRGRLRRVAGYEVLGTQLPFDWDCVSSAVGSTSRGGKWVRKKAKTRDLKYPPFGSMDRWM